MLLNFIKDGWFYMIKSTDNPTKVTHFYYPMLSWILSSLFTLFLYLYTPISWNQINGVHILPLMYYISKSLVPCIITTVQTAPSPFKASNLSSQRIRNLYCKSLGTKQPNATSLTASYYFPYWFAIASSFRIWNTVYGTVCTP